MQSCFIKRITRELNDLNKNPPSNYIVSPIDGDLFKWKATMFPPENSAYYGGKFNLDIKFPADYPFKPIFIQFSTKIYHPNVSENGSMCLDYDGINNWTPVKTLRGFLDSIYNLFTDMEPENYFDRQMVELYRTNQDQFKIKAKEHTMKWASN